MSMHKIQYGGSHKVILRLCETVNALIDAVNAVYMGMKNDVSFLLASDLNMYEQQSTWNPNRPLRCFLYAAHALEKYIHDTDQAAQMFLSTPSRSERFIASESDWR